jgi:hypothetical protein
MEERGSSFRDYLARRRLSNTPAGEFTRTLLDDPAMAEIESWPQLQAYIFRHAHAGKVKDIVDAAEPVWKGYRAYVLKSRRLK